MNKKIVSRKVRKKYREFFIEFLTYIIIGLLFYCILDYTFTPKHPQVSYTFKEYEIQVNERLWDIAEKEIENNSYYENEEVRQVIYEIEQDNNINSNRIKAGQVIKIRIKKDELSNVTDQSSIDNTSNRN